LPLLGSKHPVIIEIVFTQETQKQHPAGSQGDGMASEAVVFIVIPIRHEKACNTRQDQRKVPPLKLGIKERKRRESERGEYVTELQPRNLADAKQPRRKHPGTKC
jgi:hypothetical protein